MTESERKVERCDFVELNAMEEAGNKASVVRAGKQAVLEQEVEADLDGSAGNGVEVQKGEGAACEKVELEWSEGA